MPKVVIDIKDISKEAKIATVHALSDLHYSARKIAKILGIDRDTIAGYQNKAIDEEYHQFSATIKKMVKIKEEEAAAEALNLIREKMPQARFYELVGFYKTIRELDRPAGESKVAIQLNQIINKEREAYKCRE
jgi:transposase